MSTPRTFKDAAYAHLASVTKALAHPVRLELLDLLAQAPHTVDALAAKAGQRRANTSHHLQLLFGARLVTRKKRGLHVTYALAGDDVAALLPHLFGVAEAHLAELDALSRSFFDADDDLEPLDVTTLRARLAAGDAVLVDVRPPEEYAAGHAPGALSLPLATLDAQLDALPRDKTIVAYCRGPLCTFSAEAVRRLRARGFDARRVDASPRALEAAA